MTNDQIFTVLAVLFAIACVSALFAVLAFAVVKDDAETERAERDAIDRKAAAQRRTQGEVLRLRTEGKTSHHLPMVR